MAYFVSPVTDHPELLAIINQEYECVTHQSIYSRYVGPLGSIIVNDSAGTVTVYNDGMMYAKLYQARPKGVKIYYTNTYTDLIPKLYKSINSRFILYHKDKDLVFYVRVYNNNLEIMLRQLKNNTLRFEFTNLRCIYRRIKSYKGLEKFMSKFFGEDYVVKFVRDMLFIYDGTIVIATIKYKASKLLKADL